MAETLTFDNSTESEVLTPEEQNSLEIGQQMRADQEQLLAGKYKSVEELEKGYLEAQKQLGKSENDEPEVSEEQTEESETPFKPSAVTDLISEASTQFYESGELTSDMIEKFSSMDSKELVEAYMSMQAASPETQAAPDLNEAQVKSIMDSVGGNEAYTELTNWAANNLTESQTAGFDNLVETGNAEMIQLALQGIKAQYDNAFGSEGVQLQGKPPSNSRDVYRSQQEVVDAISDPRYDRDEAYRQDVLEKLERSDVSFR
jgi:hypothetical protein